MQDQWGSNLGMSGHIGLAIDEADESEALNVVTGALDEENSRWLKRHANLGVDGDNWAEIESILRHLALTDARRCILMKALSGTHVLGDGPIAAWGVHRPQDVQDIADALASFSDEQLEATIRQALLDPQLGGWDYPEEVVRPLAAVMRCMEQEFALVARHKWSMLTTMS